MENEISVDNPKVVLNMPSIDANMGEFMREKKGKRTSYSLTAEGKRMADENWGLFCPDPATANFDEVREKIRQQKELANSESLDDEHKRFNSLMFRSLEQRVRHYEELRVANSLPWQGIQDIASQRYANEKDLPEKFAQSIIAKRILKVEREISRFVDGKHLNPEQAGLAKEYIRATSAASIRNALHDTDENGVHRFQSGDIDNAFNQGIRMQYWKDITREQYYNVSLQKANMYWAGRDSLGVEDLPALPSPTRKQSRIANRLARLGAAAAGAAAGFMIWAGLQGAGKAPEQKPVEDKSTPTSTPTYVIEAPTSTPEFTITPSPTVEAPATQTEAPTQEPAATAITTPTEVADPADTASDQATNSNERHLPVISSPDNILFGDSIQAISKETSPFVTPDMIIIHWDGNTSKDRALWTSQNTVNGLISNNTSAHFAVGVDRTLQLLQMRDSDVERSSGATGRPGAINIEIAGSNFDVTPPTEEQFRDTVRLVIALMNQYRLTIDDIYGHYEQDYSKRRGDSWYASDPSDLGSVHFGKPDPGPEFMGRLRQAIVEEMNNSSQQGSVSNRADENYGAENTSSWSLADVIVNNSDNPHYGAAYQNAEVYEDQDLPQSVRNALTYDYLRRPIETAAQFYGASADEIMQKIKVYASPVLNDYLSVGRSGSTATTPLTVDRDGKVSVGSIVFDSGARISDELAAGEIIRMMQYNAVSEELFNTGYLDQVAGIDTPEKFAKALTDGNLRAMLELIQQKYKLDNGIGGNSYHFMVGETQEPAYMNMADWINAPFNRLAQIIKDATGRDYSVNDLMDASVLKEINDAYRTKNGGNLWDEVGLRRDDKIIVSPLIEEIDEIAIAQAN